MFSIYRMGSCSGLLCRTRQLLCSLLLQTISAALAPPTYVYDSILGLPDRTASQIELSLHMDGSAEQGLLLDTDS